MYERMLNKQETPTFEDLITYCGAPGALWRSLDQSLQADDKVSRLIRFPYGKTYGWSAKYSVKSRHICDIFAENGAFTALFQVSNAAIEPIHEDLSPYAKSIWADKTPCKGGGWIQYRVLGQEQLQDLEKIIHAKIRTK